jgi:RND family efflux transporter MFP subunit
MSPESLSRDRSRYRYRDRYRSGSPLPLPWGIITLLLFGLAVGSCSPDEPANDTGLERPVVVRTVAETVRQPVRSFAGAAKGDVETLVSFRVSGEITELPARVGMALERGDLIARLDATDYRLQVREAEAGLARAEAMLAQAEAEYERARLLYETENISRADLDNARAAFRSARAQVDAARERLGLARQQLAYTTLTSPMEGSVAEVPVELHQSVQAGQPVAMITGSGAQRFEIGMPEGLIGQVRQGAPATITFDAFPDEDFAARVVEVGVLSPQLTIFPVTLQLKETDPRIFPGMIGEATLTFAPQRSLPVVPPGAVVMDPTVGRFVWVVREDMTTERRQVEIGELTDQGIAIRSGLKPGDRVVVRGAHRVEEGQRVSVLAEGDLE